MWALVLFTLQRNLRTDMGRTWLLGYSLQPAYSGWPAGFIPTCFYSSMVSRNTAPPLGDISSPNAKGLESGLSVTSLGDKDHWGLSYHLHCRETCVPTCAEHEFCLFRLTGWFHIHLFYSSKLAPIYTVPPLGDISVRNVQSIMGEEEPYGYSQQFPVQFMSPFHLLQHLIRLGHQIINEKNPRR